MKIRYTSHFAASLDKIILYWQNQLKLSPEKINAFTVHIEKKIRLLENFPKLGQDVTDLYHFRKQTYRLLIGNSYGIFYRIDPTNNVIIVGAIFGTAEMKIKF
ncbi:type II toxin-antitoxin system RelE/ParE family toxin [Limosilactobacillus sp. STM2_1]|uniref:Type II toxin-antitoxin system RelE/ParE family toxin n=1 Tax=Limosilactobacillus rudii TaxID=2759755 RepID=A0A7W3UJD3_9LACO|nr:type II toxin-antitoxin system RelE/ParE family toxin [Limosilactobacillus rudii]MBB1078507.1 type II toxin-antitoxin system RelE/ParE family toxin [Limosilactobacillus rudii]MBB1096637.1 type II toxin-antitoxin system RelE/ParE family toxin [Limosilactobacillus rudii]MCD7134167.1 type II toxin-antitoxin system RelE/ParE family toxin [Limosilactobacillus rudii]